MLLSLNGHVLKDEDNSGKRFRKLKLISIRLFRGFPTRQGSLSSDRKLSSDMDPPEHHGQIRHGKHIVTSLWRRQKHASEVILEFYSHVADGWQKVSHGFVLIPRPLMLRLALGRFRGGWITGVVLGLSGYVYYKVFLQLLSVDIVQFTLAEIRESLNDKDELFIWKRACDEGIRKIQSSRKNSNPWIPGYWMKIYHLSLFINVTNVLRPKTEFSMMTKPFK